MRKKKKILPILAVLLGIAVIAAGFLGYQLKVSFDRYAALDSEIVANTQTVYVATRDIERGEKLFDASSTTNPDEVNIELQNIYTSTPNDYYMTIEDIGQEARIEIPYDTPVQASMVSSTDDLTKDTREVEISVAELMTSQADNDVVDVRIVFPDGSDYSILPAKKVSNLVLGTQVWTTTLNESEILTYQCAVVDAYKNEGTRIYTTRYVEPTIQEAITPNYPVSATTLDLISSDPNIIDRATETLNLQARMSLESRLSGLSEDELGLIVDGQQQNQTDLQDALSISSEDEDDAIVNDETYDALGTLEE